MDFEADCPICFESYAASTPCERREVPCCNQFLCCRCGDVLRRCPFCRAEWDDEEGIEDGDQHPWLRFRCPNPIMVAVIGQHLCASGAAPAMLRAGLIGLRAAGDVLCSVGIRAAGVARLGAVAMAEASPAVTAGAVTGTVAIVGTVAVAIASQHSDAQAQNLQRTIQSRSQPSLGETPWYEAAGRLWDAMHWFLSPQKTGLHKGTHVYHGSPWLSREREEHLSNIQALWVDQPEDASTLTTSDLLWGDLCFCFSLWLEYSPHTANWGTCRSYGLSPLHLCWHNRWREDLRHAASDLARRIRRADLQGGITTKEWACALCLLGALDYVLSWDVDTPDFGKSDLIPSDWYLYRNFCHKLQGEFLSSWAACQGQGQQADLEAIASFDLASHVGTMAAREVPPTFCDIW